MTHDELMTKMLDVFPDALLDEDADGQLIIHTGLTFGSDGSVVSMEDSR
jgi:hypothetical protein